MKILCIIFLLLASCTIENKKKVQKDEKFCFEDLNVIERVVINKSVGVNDSIGSSLVGLEITSISSIESIKRWVLSAEGKGMKFYSRLDITFISRNKDSCTLGYFPPFYLKYYGRTFVLPKSLEEIIKK